ncbi:uncharacterized protein LOC118825413 [Colossoma macropomum]|uniref:uncharacterized protein LOC118825413 n=1 Tax=Colossoma macropomum TaxID=42526 RepID=UPI00186544FC|nr:uncharacterized protein LOC118825413 [Colossoma macropomum]
MNALLYLTFLVMTQSVGGHATETFILQKDSTVRVQPGLPTSLECHVLLDGLFSIFWMKIPLNEAPVCIATAKAFVDEVAMCKQFVNHSRIKSIWKQKTFNLSFSSVEHTDVATYFCGTFSYGHFFFGKGTKLILEEHAGAVSPNMTIKDNEVTDGKMQVSEYLIPALAATNGASILLFIWLFLKKNRSGVTHEAKDADDKTDEVNCAALTFHNKQRRTIQNKTNVDTTVVYRAV